MNPIAVQNLEEILMNLPVSRCGGPTAQRITLWPMPLRRWHRPIVVKSIVHDATAFHVGQANTWARLSGPRVERRRRLVVVSDGRERRVQNTEVPSLIVECKEESQKVQMLVRFVHESMC